METLMNPRDGNPGGFYLRHWFGAFLPRTNWYPSNAVARKLDAPCGFQNISGFF
jgi:hypothetical protein